MKFDQRFAFIALLIAAGFCNAGCGKSSDKKTEKSSNGNPKTKSGVWDGDLKIVVGGLKEYRELVASHQGKIVVADMWSTWCEPCLRELPNLATTQKKYGDKVVCIAVALDYEELEPNDEEALKEIKPSVEKALRKAFAKTLGTDGAISAEFRLFISNENGETFLGGLKGDSQPTIYVYDGEGKVTQIDVNSVGGKEPTYEKHVMPVVDKLLK